MLHFSARSHWFTESAIFRLVSFAAALGLSIYVLGEMASMPWMTALWCLLVVLTFGAWLNAAQIGENEAKLGARLVERYGQNEFAGFIGLA